MDNIGRRGLVWPTAMPLACDPCRLWALSHSIGRRPVLLTRERPAGPTAFPVRQRQGAAGPCAQRSTIPLGREDDAKPAL